MLRAPPTPLQQAFLYATLLASLLAGASAAHAVLRPDLTLPPLPPLPAAAASAATATATAQPFSQLPPSSSTLQQQQQPQPPQQRLR